MEHQDTPQQSSGADQPISEGSRQLAELMEVLVRENRAQAADFLEAMRLREALSIRIGSRTTQIIRFSLATLVVMGSGMLVLILSLIAHMSDITLRMDQMSAHISDMRKDFSQVAYDVNSMNDKMGLINGQFNVLTGQVGYMTRDVNAMSSPMRMMPFRP